MQNPKSIKLLIISRYCTSGSLEATPAAAITSDVIEFANFEDADAAFNSIITASKGKGYLQITAVKLYDENWAGDRKSGVRSS